MLFLLACSELILGRNAHAGVPGSVIGLATVDTSSNENAVVSLRPSTSNDRVALIAGRDAESRRYLGEGSPNPSPTFCVLVSGAVIGWVDYDTDRSWLLPGEVNIGYNIFPDHRRRGFATRAVQLFVDHLTARSEYTVATLLINVQNTSSLHVAERLGCERQADLDDSAYFKLPIAKH